MKSILLVLTFAGSLAARDDSIKIEREIEIERDGARHSGRLHAAPNTPYG
jgi:hypothetical protein